MRMQRNGVRSGNRLTVVVPCHNAARFLRECLDSVARQTLKDVEVICIDDGSTDGTAEILDEYAERDGRFAAVHIERSGVSVARNMGIVRATGDYIGFVDADDTLDPDWLEKAEKAIVGSGADLVRLDPWNRACAPVVRPEQFLKCGFSWLTFVRADVVKAIPEPFPVGMRLREDTIFNLKVLGRGVSTCQRFCTGYRYRLNTASSVYAVQRVADFTRFVEELLPLARDMNAKDVGRAIYQSFLWWRVQRDRSEKEADERAKAAIASARKDGRFGYRHAPLLWVRGFWLADVYIALRRWMNRRWLP